MDALVASLGAGFLVALGAPALVRALGPRAFSVLALYPLALLGLVAFHRGGEWAVPWVPDLNFALAFRLDGFSRAMTGLIAFLGVPILLFAAQTLPMQANLGRFAAAFVAFMASMTGLVLSDDLITLFVFWELTSVTSFLLIGFAHEDEKARKAAQQALLVTAAGGLCLLGGFLWLAGLTGQTRLSALGPVAHLGPLTLILLGCMAKSAQFPLHFWLPNAMAAPTPVSAYLHSATMVKAGVYLLARIEVTPEIAGAWHGMLTGVGGMTVVAALVLLGGQHQMKGLLAYSTVSALGMLVFLLGLPGKNAAKAFVGLFMAHAFYKAALFLVAGALEKATGEKAAFSVSGKARALPVLASAGLLATLSSLGVVGFLGFQAKEYLILSAARPMEWAVVIAFVIGGGIVAWRIGVAPFLGAPSESQLAPVTQALPLVPALAGVGAGVAIGPFGAEFLTPMASEPVPPWVFFPGFNWAFGIGLLGIAVGVGAGIRFRPAEIWPTGGLDAAWRTWMIRLPHWAGLTFRWAERPRLRDAYALFFSVVTVLVVVGLSQGAFSLRAWGVSPFGYEYALILLSVVVGVATIFVRSRLGAIAMLGIVGTSIGLLFLTYGAPDLALTQLLTELLLIAIAVPLFTFLPRFRRLSAPWMRIRDLTVAITFGAAMGVVALALQAEPFKPHVSDYFAEAAVPEAHGRNIVNLILVDFRAMDTLGEITVLAVAALGIFGLLKLRPSKEVI